MMQRFGDWLAGHDLPSPPELSEAGIAAALAIVALALGWLAGRRIGARIAEYWSRDAEHGPLFSGRICDVIRHGVATLLLGIILSAWLWHPLAALGLGFATGAAAAMFTVAVLRGLNLPRWLAWVFAIVCFVALFSREIGGLEPVSRLAEQIGFTVGSRPP